MNKYGNRGKKKSVREVIKTYSETPLGQAQAKYILMIFVTVGLFAGGLQMIITTPQIILGVVLIAFGGIQYIELKNAKKQYEFLKSAFVKEKKPGDDKNV